MASFRLLWTLSVWGLALMGAKGARQGQAPCLTAEALLKIIHTLQLLHVDQLTHKLMAVR